MAPPANATSVLPLTDTQLVSGSDLIIRGVVTESETLLYDVGPGVFVEYRVAVTERFDGQVTPDEVIIRVPGGRTETRHMVVPGMPVFSLGEEVVLFLEALPGTAFGEAAELAYLPVGLEQGVWRESGAGWSRGAQEGLIDVGVAPDVHPLSLAEIRHMVLATVGPR